MVPVVLYGLASAIYPQLLAVVLLLLALPNARSLLWICCAAGVAMAVALNLAIFAVFRSRGTLAGTSESGLGSGAYIGIGVVTLLIALLIGTVAGRGLLDRGRGLLPRGRGARSATDSGTGGSGPRWRARLDAALSNGSMVIAAVTGALLAMPGPFDFLTAGHLARDHRSWLGALAAICVFAALKFLLIEVPSVAYVVDPDGTARRVERLSRWMQDNKMVAGAFFLALAGLVLVGNGVAGLV